ncbi:MAG: GNAT family N-acetyltransferase [Terriglobales bacterium]
MSNPCQALPKASLFHEYWWLEAATAGRFSEVEVRHGDHLVGRLPFSEVKRNGLRHLCMPDFTHVLGPLVNSGDGKPQTRMMNRLSTVESLIKRLPPFDFFRLVTDPLADDGLTAIDGVAFQTHGFQVGHQCTFHLDCRVDLKILQAGMESRVRQNIRRAEERLTVKTIDDPDRFVAFYLENLRKANRRSYVPFNQFFVLFSECRARNCGLALAAMQPSGVPVAMTFIVWDSNTMYYLLTTRAPNEKDNGSVSLLIWSAMQRAHDLGLTFDLDGVTTAGTARFLSGFGGAPRMRQVITGGRTFYNMVQSVKTILHCGRPFRSSFD